MSSTRNNVISNDCTFLPSSSIDFSFSSLSATDHQIVDIEVVRAHRPILHTRAGKDTTSNRPENIRFVSVIRAVHLVRDTIVEIVVRLAVEVHVEQKVVERNHLVEMIVDNADHHPIEIAVDRPQLVTIIRPNIDDHHRVDLANVIANGIENVTESETGNATGSVNVSESVNGIVNDVDRRVLHQPFNNRLNELLFICTNLQVLGKKHNSPIAEATR